jgi:preprotein translocase subunit SecB
MADQEPSAGGNGADDNSQPQVSILAQYVKDLSVENPSAPQVYSWQVRSSTFSSTSTSRMPATASTK